MKRRLLLQAASAGALLGLGGCGGGGDDNAGSGAASASGSSLAQNASSEAVAGAGLPSKVLGCYYTSWDTGTYRIDQVPAEFNLIYLFHAKPQGYAPNGNYNNVGDGSFFFEHYADVTAAQVQACRARGQKVILTVGGAQAGYAWDERAKSTRFVASFKTMYERLGGFDGIDFNNFEGSIVHDGNVAAVTAEMVWICRELRAAYGDAFAVTSPPAPNEPLQQALMASLKAAGVLTYAGAQYYDWTGFNEPGYIEGRTDRWVSLLGDAQSVVVGLSANYANGPSLDDCIREWDRIKTRHPDIRGMFCWSAQTQMAGGNVWGQAMRQRL